MRRAVLACAPVRRAYTISLLQHDVVTPLAGVLGRDCLAALLSACLLCALYTDLICYKVVDIWC